MKQPLPPGIHIILGDSAAGSFTRAFDVEDRLLIDQDVLNCGPTPVCTDLQAWGALRRNYWASLVPGGESGHVPAPNNLFDNVHRLRDADGICVWAATCMSEQFFIANVLRVADLLGADAGRISVVQYESLRKRRARVMGMGELDEEQISDHPDPKTLSRDALADYRAAWTALTSEDPNGLARFAKDRPGANAWLREAMDLLLRRFPDKRSGLSFWDQKLLRVTREKGPGAARIIGHAMVEDWGDPDLTGDWYLFDRLLRLGDERLPKPLLAMKGDRTKMRELDVMLTPFGEAVLDGKSSNYPANPIEDWVGGTRLSSAEGKLWFNDAGRVVQ